MAQHFVTLLVFACVFYTSAHHRADQYNLRSKNKESEQCIPEHVLDDYLHSWCKKKPQYDPEVLKKWYTEDATFQYMDQPVMKVQENIEMMAAFMKEFNTYYNLTKCSDFVGKYEVLGCEHQSIPAVVKGTITVKSKDKKHVLNGPYSMEYRYVNGEIKMSHFVTKAAIDPTVFKQIWEKVVKLFPEMSTSEDLEATTVSNEDDDDDEMATETKPQVYNSKQKGKEQCIPEKDLNVLMDHYCSNQNVYDLEIYKKIFSKDATFQYMNKPPMKVQDNLKLLVGMKKEIDTYFNINTCEDFRDSEEVLGCEHNTIPAILKETVNVQGKDKKHSLKGSSITEFKYENGHIKISKSICKVIMDPLVFKQIWEKVEKELEAEEETSTASPDNYEEEEEES